MFRLAALVAALNVVVFAIVGLALYRSLLQTRDDTAAQAASMARVLEENLNRYFDKVNLTLMAVADEIARQERAGGVNRTQLEYFLARHDARLPEALGLRVVNSAGMVEYAVSNVRQPGGSAADRDYFRHLRDHDDGNLFISQPMIGRLNPQPIIIAARRRLTDGADFRGIVHAAIAVSSLQNMFAEVDLGDSGSVGLWNEDATLMARFSNVGGGGTPKASETLRTLISTHQGPTVYHTVSQVDGLERIFAFRKVSGWPLYVVVGIADRDYLAPWWGEVRFLCSLSGLFLLSSLAAGGAIARGMLAQDNARAEAESARRHSTLVLTSAGEGICGVDAAGHVTFANRAARRLLGWRDDEGDGWNFHAAVHHHHADGTPYSADSCPACSRNFGPNPEPRHVEGEVYWRRDGTSFPVEYTAAPVIEDGQVVGVVNVFRDISERQGAEERLRLSEMRSRALLNAPTDGALLMDRDGVVLDGNEAFAADFGRQVQDLIGRSLFELLPPAVAAERKAAFEQVLATKLPVDKRSDHGARVFDTRLFPIIGSDGEVAQVALFARDITEQQKAAGAIEKALADLARSNEELQQFAYVASHDLRQPLRMVTSYLNLIERRLGDRLDGEIKEFMDFATDGARRMDRLILDLLDYSRAGRGSAPLAPTPLGPVVADAVQNLEVTISEAGAAVNVAEDLPTVMGDGPELTRLFQNLIGNAVKYRSPDRPPCVDVGWRIDGRDVVLWVRDNGVGIDAADYQRAFRIFQRLSNSGACEGSGIGLAVCRKIADRHGGRIWIESTPGEGSTFLVALPITAAAPAA